MSLVWLLLNSAIYVIGVFALSNKKEMLGSVLVIYASTSILIYSLKWIFHREEWWVILIIGGPVLLIMNIVARALAKKISK